MTEYCNNEKLRVWNLGRETACDGDFERCKYVVWFGKQAYCGHCPPRVGLHQLVRGQAGCLWCKYATKRLDYTKCVDCLSSGKRVNFEPCEDCPKEVIDGRESELHGKSDISQA